MATRKTNTEQFLNDSFSLDVAEGGTITMSIVEAGEVIATVDMTPEQLTTLAGRLIKTSLGATFLYGAGG